MANTGRLRIEMPCTKRSTFWTTNPALQVLRSASLVAVGLFIPFDAQGQSIRLETVSDYTLRCGSTACDTDANVEGAGFWSQMTAAGSGWTAGSFYQDDSVWDVDFYDPDLTGGALDFDGWSDAAGTGIAWFIGHGECNDAATGICITDADCAAGTYCPGGRIPAGGYGHKCIAQQTHSFLTSSTGSHRGNRVTYGQAYLQPAAKSIALGEDAASGSWGGAGTNGGINVAMITNSCGFRSRYLSTDTTFMFAGIHALFAAMPIGVWAPIGVFLPANSYADTSQWAERGSNLASIIVANPNAPMSDAWLNPAMVAGNNGFTGGVPGVPSIIDGANVVVSKDTTLASVQFHTQTETWTQSKIETNDAKGLGYWWYRYVCNYNCNTYGM